MLQFRPVEPFYFGGDGIRRFGVYHPPRGAAGTAIVLCYPLGLEYIRAHRAFRNLALSLSRAGHAVLRFDYTGSGDSSGEEADAGVSSWSRDLELAIEELKTRAGVPRVALVGLRFGATLAALAGARRDDVERILLWDPVLRGEVYLDELRGIQARWMRDRLGIDADRLASGDDELMGMPARPPLLEELARIDLRQIGGLRAGEVEIVVSSAREDCLEWQQTLRDGGCQVRYFHVPTAGDWLDAQSLHQLLLPHEILKQIVALLSE
ncbi:MAG: alpha/beta fold hydrolase [Acidobacteria bacterium]|nr:alpha/beta fold hydrolase [Acidobacteriota bacterium]